MEIIGVVVWIGMTVACGAIASSIMKNKGRSAGAGWAMGLLLGWIGVIICAVLSRKDTPPSYQPPYQ